MANVFRTSLRVRFSEIDLYGHVHHAEYLKYLEWARMEHLKQEGLSFVDLMDKGFYVVVVNANLDFVSPAMYDEELVVSGYVNEVGTTSLSMIQEIEERETGRSVLRAEFTFVFLNRDREKVPVPKHLLEALL